MNIYTFIMFIPWDALYYHNILYLSTIGHTHGKYIISVIKAIINNFSWY